MSQVRVRGDISRGINGLNIRAMSHRPEPVNTFHPAADLRIRDVEQILAHYNLLLAIDKCISIYTYSVFID